MIKIADIIEKENGKKTVKLFSLGIYDLLREVLGFRYTKINNKGYYLKESDGIYKVVNFFEMRDAFTNYITDNFNTIEFNAPIDFNTFINEYYRKSPIKNGDYAKRYLGENFILSDVIKNQILQELENI